MNWMSFIAGGCLGAVVASIATLVIWGKIDAADRAMQRQALERAGDCPKCAERLPVIAMLQRFGPDFNIVGVTWHGSAGDADPIDTLSYAVRCARGLPKA